MNKNIELGQILESKSHIDYICEVYKDEMRENPPGPTDYEFGQFVYIKKDIEGKTRFFIGVIYDTRIVDPDQGRAGPRLSQPDEQNVFQPTYVDEKKILVGITLLGYLTIQEGEIVDIDHSIPRWTLEVDDVVYKLSDEKMVEFHILDGEIKLKYYQRIIDVAEDFAEDILIQIIEKLKNERPEEKEALNVIKRNLEWQTKIKGG